MIKLIEVIRVNKTGAKIIRISLGIVLLFLGSLLSISGFTPHFTLQTLCIFLLSVVLKPTEAFLSTFIYVLLGTVGVPVFASLHGGLDVMRSVSGGFIISFPFISLFISFLSRKFPRSLISHAVIFSVANIFCYLFALLWIRIWSLWDDSFVSLLKTYILPFLPFDIVKILLACLCTKKLWSAFKNDNQKKN